MNAQPAPVTREEVSAAIQAASAVAEAIRDLGSVPSGELYVQLMQHMSLATYEAILNILQRADLVVIANHVVRWTGPKA